MDADRAYCERFTGSNGGLNATRLSIYPFLKEIANSLVNSATGKSPIRLNLFSGHDTVIAPVLAALGVYQDPELCKWPQYASRISFELWKGLSTSSVPTSSSSSETEAAAIASHYVRVVFNGQDVTKKISTCAKEMNGSGFSSSMMSSAAASSNGHTKMCSLHAFVQQIDSLIAPYSSIQAACGSKMM